LNSLLSFYQGYFMQRYHHSVHVTLIMALGLVGLSPAANAFNFGDMMNPMKMFQQNNKDRERNNNAPYRDEGGYYDPSRYDNYGAYGAQPYGNMPPRGAYGAQPYGNMPPPGAYGAQPYGNMPPPGAYGAQPYGNMPPPGAYGAYPYGNMPPRAYGGAPYGAMPPRYGAPPYGAVPPPGIHSTPLGYPEAPPPAVPATPQAPPAPPAAQAPSTPPPANPIMGYPSYNAPPQGYVTPPPTPPEQREIPWSGSPPTNAH
jgi:hypothetical protein